MRILENLNWEQQTTIVMVTHDPRLAERTERTIRLFDGRQGKSIAGTTSR